MSNLKTGMMKKTYMKIAGLAIAALLMSFNLDAQRPGGRGNGQGYGPGQGACMQPGDRAERMAAYLELTEEQQAQLTELRITHQKSMTPLRNEMNEIRARQRTLMSEEEVDLNAVNKNIDKQSALQAKMKKEAASHRVAMKDVLSDEQEFKMQQLQRKGKARRGSGHGKGPGCRAPRGSGMGQNQ